jgi:aminoglycoside N3'-acetyltransferase
VLGSLSSGIAEHLRALGVRQGGVLLVHTSFRAARPVEGGPVGLIGGGATRRARTGGHAGDAVLAG